VIDELLLDFELFWASFLSGLFVAMLLAAVGVIVVARDQIFLGAAISQASTLGVAVALVVGAAFGHEAHWLESPRLATCLAVVASTIAAVITATRGGHPGRESREAVTGWVFLAAASVAILLVTDSAHGKEEIHNLLFSSIVVATPMDVCLFGGLALVTMAFLAARHRPLLLWAIDPAMAAAVGLRTRVWSLATAAWLGVAIGLAISSSGLLFTFGCLVLPALAGKSLVREIRPLFVVAPLIAVVTAAVGFVLAHRVEYPPGQLTIAFLSGLVALGWGVSWLRRKRAA